MDEIKRIAEDYLRIASCDVEGYLYPNQIYISKTKLREVLNILTPYGKEISGEQNGATPIYKKMKMDALSLLLVSGAK